LHSLISTIRPIMRNSYIRTRRLDDDDSQGIPEVEFFTNKLYR